jgi:hypothetical protein
MRFVISFLSILMLSLSGGAHAADVVPKRTEFGRYQAMLDHSPFAVATAAALPAATPNFAKDLYIANAARSPEGDLVTLASASDRNFKEYLSTRQPNEHGYGIANIEWSEKVGQTKVTISKDGQFASISFNQALLSTTGTGSPGAPAPVLPNAQPNGIYPMMPSPVPAQVTKPAVPAAVPALPTPPPRVRGVIPRNPSAAAQTPVIVPPVANNDE